VSLTLLPESRSGVARPRVEVRPDGIVDSLVEEAVELAGRAGLNLDPWQRDGLDLMLSIREDGRWACPDYAEWVSRQNGKALDCDTPILTTAGWSTMGALTPGDELFHPDGHPTRVVAVSEVMAGRECFEVSTTDGRSVVADANHLWTVQDWRRGTWATVTTRSLAAMRLFATRQRPGGVSRDYRLRLPVQHAIVSKPVDLPIEPYLFGAWLGDGSSGSAHLTVGSQDVDEMQALVLATGAEIVSVRPTHTAWALRFRTGPMRDGFESRARRLGLWRNKHVPDVYLAAGDDQRLALLQGLMDTDGSIESRRGQVEFCSTRRCLADAVQLLARSLGWRATIKESAATLNGREVGRRWRVMWTVTTDDPPPFRLARKVARIPAPRGRLAARTAVSVASVVPVATRPVRCIRVERPDGLFLAGHGLMPTHNSAGLLAPRAVLGFLALDEHLILWSSHRVDTTMRSFKFVEKLLRKLGRPMPGRLGEFYIEFPDDGFTVKINGTHGHEGFERLDTQAELKFVARSARGGRGMDPECLILDEAFALNDAQMEAQAPATAAQPNAQVILTSTPPLDGESGQVMFRTRERAESDDPGLLGYRDWGLATSLADLAAMEPGERRAFLDDRANWGPPNPSLGSGRLGESALQRLRRILSEEGFARECFGMWPVLGAAGSRLISSQAWRLAERPGSVIEGTPVFGVDVNPERTAASIGAAGLRPDGGVLVELPRPVRGMDPDEVWPSGTEWVVERAVELDEQHGPTLWAIDANGPAGPLAAPLEDAGLEVVRLTGPELARACMGFVDVLPFHLGDALLDDAVEAVRKRPIGDGAWAFGRKNSGANIAPAVAVAIARHVLLTQGAPLSVPPMGAAPGEATSDTSDLGRMGF